MKNWKPIHKKNLECLANEIYKFLHGLFPPIMNVIFEIKVNIYNLRNFQSLCPTCKTTVKFGTERVTYRGPQIWNLIPDDIKYVSSLENFKREIKK